MYLLFPLVLFVFASCSSSDDEPTVEETHNSKKEQVGFSVDFSTEELVKDSLDGEFKKNTESKIGSRAAFSTIYLINGSNQSLPLSISADVASFAISVKNSTVYGSGGGVSIPLTDNCYLVTSSDGKAEAEVSPVTTPNGQNAYSPFGDRLFKSEKTFKFKYTKKKNKYTYKITVKEGKKEKVYECDKHGNFGSFKVNLKRQSAKITTNVFIFAGWGILNFYNLTDFEKDTETIASDWSIRTFISGAPNVYNQKNQKEEGNSILCITESRIAPDLTGDLSKFFSEGSIWVKGIGHDFGADVGSHIFPMSAANKHLGVSFYYKGTNPKFRRFNTLMIPLNSFEGGRNVGLLEKLEPDVHYTLDVIFHKQDLIDQMKVPSQSKTRVCKDDANFGPIMNIPYQVRLVATDRNDN